MHAASGSPANVASPVGTLSLARKDHSMKQPRRTAAVLCMTILLLAATAVTIDQSAAADEARDLPPPQAVDNSTCLQCHGQSGGLAGQHLTLPSGDRIYLTVDDSTFQESVHGQLGFACVTCHTDHTEYPHPPASQAPPGRDRGCGTHQRGRGRRRGGGVDRAGAAGPGAA